MTMRNAICFSLFAFVFATAQAQFTPGNLAVLRIGDGAAALANTGNGTFIDQYATSGSLVNSLSIPSTGSGALVLSGTATAEGALARSSDGQYLTFYGYNRAVGGVGSVSASTGVPRVVAVVDYNQIYAAGPSTGTVFDGSNVRSAVTDGNNNFWGTGGARGTFYAGNGPTNVIQTALTVNRTMNIVNGNLMFVNSSAATIGIQSFTGTPMTTASPTRIIDTGAGSSPYDFAFNAAMTLAYIADDRAVSGNTAGGIQRWDFNGSTWGLTYVIDTGTVGARGLAVDFSGVNPVLYATTAESSLNRLVSYVDTGDGVTTTLATAGANTIFRGLDFTPVQVPEPSTFALLGIGGLAALLGRRKVRK